MDLLSMVGMVTKRRQDYLSQAQSLAQKLKEQPNLEERMMAEARVLVRGLKDKQMRWEEYERSVIDKTLISALAAVYLGANDKQNQRMEKAWPIIVGDMLPPLTKFLAETKEYIDSGVLRLGDQTLDFADPDLFKVIPGAINLEADKINKINPEESGIEEAKLGRSQGKTWLSLLDRVIRYISSPTFSFFNLGRFMAAQDQGFKEMRRIAKRDKKTCADCKTYGDAGWAPIGELPMPGKGCQCYDRCRCSIEYR